MHSCLHRIKLDVDGLQRRSEHGNTRGAVLAAVVRLTVLQWLVRWIDSPCGQKDDCCFKTLSQGGDIIAE